MNNERDVSLWLKGSTICGVAYVGAAIAGSTVLSVVFGGIGGVTLLTWADKRFNNGRISREVRCGNYSLLTA